MVLPSVSLCFFSGLAAASVAGWVVKNPYELFVTLEGF